MKEVKCPICRDKAMVKEYFKDDRVRLEKCSVCGLIFQNPQKEMEELSKETYDRAYYDTYYPEDAKYEMAKKQYDLRLQRLEDLREGKKGKILDLGCGRGAFLEAAKNRGWEVFGIELSEAAADIAKEKFGLEAIKNKIVEEAGFEENMFDVINMNHVLEHVPCPDETLKVIYKILKPGGLFYCEIPRQSNILNFLSNIVAKKDFGFNYMIEHLYLFDFKSLKFLLEQADFKIKEMKLADVGEDYRFVRGVHYHSWVTHMVVLICKYIKINHWCGGGNLWAISEK